MTPDAIDEMVKAGASVEVLAALWKSQLREQSRLAEEKRAKDRDRQRHHRSSRDVTECHGDTADVTSGHDEKKNPQTPKENNTPLNGSPKGEPIPPQKSRKARSAAFEVPDWIPAEPWEAFAEMRRRKRKQLDDFTAKQLFGRLRSIKEAGWNIEDVIVKATVACHDGFWMPDGRDSNVRRATGKDAVPERPMNIAQLRSAIAFAEDNNNPDRAAELKAQLERLTARQPPGQIGAIVRQAAKSIQANAA